MKGEITYFNIKNGIVFLNINDLGDILKYKDEIDKNIDDDKVIALAIICADKVIHSNMNQDQKAELYKWFNSLMVISIGIVNKLCHGDLFEMFMMFDIRLGGKNLSIEFPKNGTEFVFDFEERCQLLMGNKRSPKGYRSLLNTTKNSNEIYELRLINRIIDMDDILNEVQKYVNRIMSNKDNYQIRAIIKCFNSYKQFGINSNMNLLLEEEGKQFCTLILRDYINKEEIK